MARKSTRAVRRKITRDRVWNKAKPIRGRNPARVRQDPYGNRLYKNRYGKTGRGGWELDHIRPKSRGGSDHIRNLQALKTEVNRGKGDSLVKKSRHTQKRRDKKRRRAWHMLLKVIRVITPYLAAYLWGEGE